MFFQVSRYSKIQSCRHLKITIIINKYNTILPQYCCLASGRRGKDKREEGRRKRGEWIIVGKFQILKATTNIQKMVPWFFKIKRP
jgi:hypothetical protein